MGTQPDAVQQFVASEQANLTAVSTALDSIVAGIKSLDALITSLEQQLTAAGTLSAADQQALNTVVAASAALVSKAQGVSTAAPAAPAPGAAADSSNP